MEEPDRPQPRLDRETDRGYAVSVGRVREDESGIFDIKFVALSHNSKQDSLRYEGISSLTRHSGHWSCGLVDTERGGRGTERIRLKAVTRKQQREATYLAPIKHEHLMPS